jgi:hydroxyacylglutathione hydrolase
MFFRMIYDEKLAQAAYLIGCQQTGEAIIFDPQRDVDRYVETARREGLRIVATAETHIHADFLSGSRELAESGVRVLVSDEGDAAWKYEWLNQRSGGGAYEHLLLHHDQRFSIGRIEFRVIHTPGHTPEHLCFAVTDRGAGADVLMGVISGDFLFVGDLGRPDLLETAAGAVGASEPGARQLFASLRRLADLPEWVQVWPGHGAGSACGKALGAIPQTTLGYERRFNTAMRAAVDEAAFVKFILEGQPEPPLYFARMKRDNKRGPRVLGRLPAPPRMAASELAAVDGARAALIDTRPWAEFRGGHVRGSLYHPLNSSFTTDVGSMVREDEPLYLILESARVNEAVRDLVRIGLDDVRGYCEPADLRGLPGLTVTQEISVAELNAGSDALILDVRRRAEFEAGHIRGATNIAHTRLAAELERLPRGRRIAVHCQAGGRSARACALLQKHGFDVANVTGGFGAWRQAGFSVEK